MEIEQNVFKEKNEYNDIEYLKVNELLATLKENIKKKNIELSQLEIKTENDNCAAEILEALYDLLDGFSKISDDNFKLFIDSSIKFVDSLKKDVFPPHFDFFVNTFRKLTQIVSMLKKNDLQSSKADNHEIWKKLENQLKDAKDNLKDFNDFLSGDDLKQLKNAIEKCNAYLIAVKDKKISAIDSNGHQANGTLFLFENYPDILKLILQLNDQTSSYKSYNKITKKLSMPDATDPRERILHRGGVHFERNEPNSISHEKILELQRKFEARISIINEKLIVEDAKNNDIDSLKITAEVFLIITNSMKKFLEKEIEFQEMKQGIYRQFKDAISLTPEDFDLVKDLTVFFDENSSDKIHKQGNQISSDDIIKNLKKCLQEANEAFSTFASVLGDIAIQASKRCQTYLQQLNSSNFDFLIEGDDDASDEINQTLFAEFPKIPELFAQLKSFIFPRSSIPRSSGVTDLSKIIQTTNKITESKLAIELDLRNFQGPNSGKDEDNIEEDFCKGSDGQSFVP